MATAYDKVIPALKKLLPSEGLQEAARAVAFIRRLRAVQGCAFVWSVVLSRFGQGLPGFSQARQWYQRLTNRELWPRPFQMRFKSAATVKLFAGAFESAVSAWRNSETRRPKHPLARRFADIVALDTTLVQVADSLDNVFPGTRGTPAALKIMVAISVFGLLPLYAKLFAGAVNDHLTFPSLSLFRTGTLLLFDRGFLSYERFAEINAAGHFYLSPGKCNAVCLIVAVRQGPFKLRKQVRQNPDGVLLRGYLSKYQRTHRVWDLDVIVFGDSRRSEPIRTRLVIIPTPAGDQRRYFTNLSPLSWHPKALRELYRLRWQIELVFKELKQHLNLQSLPTHDPQAAQVLVWASLIALALSRTVTAVLCPLPSLVGLAAEIRSSLVSRLLTSTLRLLVPLLASRPVRAAPFLRLFADELASLARSRERHRRDSFSRIVPMLRAA